MKRSKRLTRRNRHTLALIERYAQQRAEQPRQYWTGDELAFARQRSREEWQKAEQLKRCFALLTEGQHERINAEAERVRDQSGTAEMGG